MKLRKRSKKAILSSLIALALSSSTVFAMPTGGTVVSGNVNGVTSGSLADLMSGGALNVNGSSLIDWKSFGIADGEVLNIVYHGNGDNMLINHVTGGDISQLLGTLNANKGEGGFMLINPNGIVVGSKAQLNVGSLFLSTLDAGDNELKEMLENGVSLKLSNTKNGSLVIDSGANIHVEDTLNLYGAKIQIADGVTISNDLQMTLAGGNKNIPDDNDLKNCKIFAANEVNLLGENGETEKMSADNTLDLGAVTFSNKGHSFNLYMGGGKVTTKGAKLGTDGEALTETHIIAASGFNGDYGKNVCKTSASADNVLALENTQIVVAPKEVSSAGIVLDGGAIQIKNSNLNTKEGYLKLRAFKEMTEDDSKGVNLTIDPKNVISVSEKSTLQAKDSGIGLTAGNITIDNSTVESTDGALRMIAGKTVELQVKNITKRTDDGELRGTYEPDSQNGIAIVNNATVGASIKDKQEVLKKDNNPLGAGRLQVFAPSIKAENSTLKATDRIEVHAADFDKDTDTTTSFSAKTGREVIFKDAAIKGGDISLVGYRVALQGNTTLEKPDERFFVAGAGSSVTFGMGNSEYDSNTYTSVKEAAGPIELSQTTKDNLGNLLTNVNYKIVADNVQPEPQPQPQPQPADVQDNTAAEVSDILSDNSLTDKQREQKLAEEMPKIRESETNKEMQAQVRAHVDGEMKVMPETQEKRPVIVKTDAEKITVDDDVKASNVKVVTGVEEN